MYILFSKNFACVKKMTNMRYVWFVKCCLDQQSNVFVCLRSNEVALGPLLNGMVPTCTWWSEAVSQVSKLLGSTFLALFRRVRHVSCLKAAGDLSSPVPPLISSRFRLILWYFFCGYYHYQRGQKGCRLMIWPPNTMEQKDVSQIDRLTPERLRTDFQSRRVGCGRKGRWSRKKVTQKRRSRTWNLVK